MTNNRNIYTVRQVNSYVKRMFEDDFVLRSIYIKGEISNCKYHSSGHIYFSLKDEGGVISAVMFSSNAASLRFRLADGMQVIAYGSVSTYEKSGTYQLYVRSMEQDGLGDLYRQFNELKAKLEEMGMFSDIYKKPIPPYAMKIGIVTAKTGAVIRDIYNVASRRNPYCRLTLYPAQVQGEGAAKTICAGIRKLDKMGLDCIIIGRGGGSIEDLWCFNDENLARTIFECNTPVISAVGHETDFTIADFVADLRAPTPSAAAELAVFDYNRFMMDLDGNRDTLDQIMGRALDRSREKVKMYSLKILNLSPEKVLLRKKQDLENMRSKISLLLKDKLGKHREMLKVMAERLSGLSPLKRISEGYAFVTDDAGRAVASIKNISEGSHIEINVSDGRIGARVESVKEAAYE